jgi:hypothetical protein
MHFGDAIKTLKNSELWHGELWAESPLFCQGRFSTGNDEFFLGEFICYLSKHEGASLGRICQIWQESQSSDILVGIQRIAKNRELSKELQRQLDPENYRGFFLDEDIIIVEPNSIVRRVNCTFMEKDDVLGKVSARELSLDPVITDIVYTHLSSGSKSIRSCDLRRVLPSEIHFPDTPPRPMRILRFFLTIFFDDMGAFRHTYHALGGCYLIIGNMPSNLRQLLRNIFLIGFVPFGCTFDNFIVPIINDLKKLQQGEVWIIDGEEYWVIAGEVKFSKFAFAPWIVLIFTLCRFRWDHI